jgi:hypothetical protein
MARNDVPLGRGQCDIRLQVDNEVEVSVRGDSVMIRTISGRDAMDDGSECNIPLPDRVPTDFNFEVKDSRGEIRLMDPPSRRTNFAAVVRIRDSSGGQGRYHFRLTWDERAADYRPGPSTAGGFGDRPRQGPPAFRWDSTLDFRGEGRGAAEMGRGVELRLFNCNVEITRGGRVTILFRAERGRELAFTGEVVGREGGRLRADVVSADRRYRGPMFISLGERDNVNSVTFQDGEGRDRMRITWDRR